MAKQNYFRMWVGGCAIVACFVVSGCGAQMTEQSPATAHAGLVSNNSGMTATQPVPGREGVNSDIPAGMSEKDYEELMRVAQVGDELRMQVMARPGRPLVYTPEQKGVLEGAKKSGNRWVRLYAKVYSRDEIPDQEFTSTREPGEAGKLEARRLLGARADYEYFMTPLTGQAGRVAEHVISRGELKLRAKSLPAISLAGRKNEVYRKLAIKVARELLESDQSESWERAIALYVLAESKVLHQDEPEEKDVNRALEEFKQAGELWLGAKEMNGWALTEEHVGNIRGYLQGDVVSTSKHVANAQRVWTRKEYPDKWGELESSLGLLIFLGDGQKSETSARKGLIHLKNAAEVLKLSDGGDLYGRTHSYLAEAISWLGDCDSDENYAAFTQAHREADKGWSQKSDPEMWALNQMRLATYLENRRTGDEDANLREALSILEKARPEAEKHLQPGKLFEFEIMFGDLTFEAGKGGKEAVLKGVIGAFERGVAVDKKAVPASWRADAYLRLGVAQTELAALAGQDRMELLKKAKQNLLNARGLFDEKEDAKWVKDIDALLKRIEEKMK
jgi:hypothetical protein